MESVFVILSQQFGLQTVIKAVVVCVVMMLVKKIKPNLSPKVEVVIRLAVSVLIHLLFTVVTNGEFLDLTESAMSVCGVSMIFSAIVSKNCDSKELKETIQTYLPDFDTAKIDECLNEVTKTEAVEKRELIDEGKARISISS